MTKSQNTKKDLCITVEKQVWESTLHRSMVLEAENAHLKELLKELFETADLVYCEEDLLDKIDEVLK